MKYYFLGQAANYSRKQRLHHTFAIGTINHSNNLRDFLAQKYNGAQVALTKNGRSALCLALQAAVPAGSKVVVNGFTCYAVIEAIKAAKMTPVFADIDKETLHYTPETLEKVLDTDVKAIIIQNTFGIPVDIATFEKIAKKHNLKIIEDLAHCTGVKYADGREAGTVGFATALSFGKDKSIDTITGGAVIVHTPSWPTIQSPNKMPRFADTFRARFYPLFGAIYRSLTHIKCEKAWMGLLLKIHWVERSADNRLDLERRPAHFEAKLALEQLLGLPEEGRAPIRTFAFVNNRAAALRKLAKNGYRFDGYWYDRPVAPARYYKKVHFPEESCPVAVEVANTIINFPTYYTAEQLTPALKIIEEYQA